MKYIYKPKNKLEQFGFLIYNLLVDNFPQTFYVGGMVRDLLLGKSVTDIDIATSATPDDVIKILRQNKINYNSTYKNFGVIVAKSSNLSVEIATFRKDSYTKSRYPKVAFVNSPKQDSQRRDFTINALYLSPKSNSILDFHSGLRDLKIRSLKFIGNPSTRIKQDPLRIIRVLRFAAALNLNLDAATESALQKNKKLISTLTQTKISNELSKVKKFSDKKSIINFLNS